ncbi:MAG TPA: class I SAM-dependent methyltransferase [Dyadobacter sp.]|jgi:2-polyprenyl-3-methyl-5-hydroxy-6-metoxy-1,4-benzoquinol methylase|nr:class I SAM-dependent methyltransferase [Dyadobacter sp.]
MPLETLKKCPVCDADSFSNYLNVEDYTVSHKEFTIQQCNACYFLLTNPRPSADEIGAYYQSEEYISHHDDSKDIMSRVYTSVRNHTIKEKLKLLNGLHPGKGSLLDIGCGTGNFIQACKENGWQVAATEPDSGARTIAEKRVGETISETINAPGLQNKKYDVITLWHVLEHVHELNESVKWLHDHVNENGTIIIAVPNPQSFDALEYRRFWAAYDVPRHLYHFTKSSMKKLMEKHELHVRKVLPMWFDSFYVSMLSTKYRGKSVSLVNSLKTGIISNLKGKSAKADGTNTSSLIYIITK